MGLFDVFHKKAPKATETVAPLAGSQDGLTAEELFELGKQSLDHDDAKAFVYFLKAAEMGHVKAMRNTGVCYWRAKGTGFDVQKAVYWYKKAAEHGNVPSMRDLSTFYVAGIAVEKDDDVAKAWLKKAADAGDEKAVSRLRDFDQLKDLLAQRMRSDVEQKSF